jgi:hypothetical protein
LKDICLCILQADIDLLPEAIEETLWKVSQEAFSHREWAANNA